MVRKKAIDVHKLHELLGEFTRDSHALRKGSLSVALVISRIARESSPPYTDKNFLTDQGGQVKGLSRSAVQAILSDHGIDRILAEEGGRTSRGSLGRMRKYLDLLNRLHAQSLLDFDEIEKWWIGRVREYFASKPIVLRIDQSKSLRQIVRELIDAAIQRQRECPGTMIAGAVMEHLVGAKLQIAVRDGGVEHKGFSEADSGAKRPGDFIIRNTVVHVTTAPTEALIRKCVQNLGSNLRPLIITTEKGVGGAEAHARNAEIEERIDILDIEQFVATNVYEWSGFDHSRRGVTLVELIDAYNKIVSSCETDPSLLIEIR